MKKMFEVCLGSAFLTFLIYVVLSNLLLFMAIDYSDGQVKDMIAIIFLFSIGTLMLFPLLLALTAGVC